MSSLGFRGEPIFFSELARDPFSFELLLHLAVNDKIGVTQSLLALDKVHFSLPVIAEAIVVILIIPSHEITEPLHFFRYHGKFSFGPKRGKTEE